jgi:sec-independent protein translocase protein TatA
MGALEPWHLAIILFIVMLLFGAKHLPELARSMGSSVRELKKGLKEDEQPEQKAEVSQPVLQAAVAPDTAIAEAGAPPVVAQPATVPPQG